MVSTGVAGAPAAEIAVVLGKNPDLANWWVGQGVHRPFQDDSLAGTIDVLDQEMASVQTSGSVPDGES